MKDGELTESERLKLSHYAKDYDILDEDEDILKVLSNVCKGIEHYSKMHGGCMPKIEITSQPKKTERSRGDEPDLTIEYEGPIHESTSGVLNEFDQLLSKGTIKNLGRHKAYERINFKIKN